MGEELEKFLLRLKQEASQQLNKIQPIKIPSFWEKQQFLPNFKTWRIAHAQATKGAPQEHQSDRMTHNWSKKWNEPKGFFPLTKFPIPRISPLTVEA